MVVLVNFQNKLIQCKLLVYILSILNRVHEVWQGLARTSEEEWREFIYTRRV